MQNIIAAGAYLPLRRLDRRAVSEANAWFAPGQRMAGERAIAGWDEDALTMAVEAARSCLQGRDPADLGALFFASTTHPFEDRQNGVIVAEALDLARRVENVDLSGGLRAGTSGLITALRKEGETLVVASDRRPAKPGSTQEMTYGDGAAALWTGPGAGLARVIGARSMAADFVDHHRGRGAEFDYGWEERWVRDEGYMKLVPAAVAPLLAEAGVDPASVAHFCIAVPNAKLATAIATACGVSAKAVADPLLDSCGDTGAAHPLLLLAHVLERAKAGERVLVVGFGQGVDALLLEVTGAGPPKVAPALARRRPETNYPRYLALNGLLPTDRGIRAEGDRQTPLTALYRHHELVHGMKGGRCTACGTLQIPRAPICVNPNCRAAGRQEPHRFADEPAEIVTFTADRLCYTPDPPAVYGMVQFKAGGRLFIDFADAEPDTLDVGHPMRMVFRVKERDPERHFVRYFWKALPEEV
jgi:hydroxymethylglutaryl-CoA synthase